MSKEGKKRVKVFLSIPSLPPSLPHLKQAPHSTALCHFFPTHRVHVQGREGGGGGGGDLGREGGGEGMKKSICRQLAYQSRD